MSGILGWATKGWPLAVAMVAVLACSGVEVTNPESGLPSSGPELPTGGGGGGDGEDSTAQTLDPALVGSWTRLLLFTDVDGTERGSRLTFQFRADSTFTRTLVTSNFTQGIDDTIVEGGRWSTLAGTLVLRFNPGALDERSSRFSYRTARRADGNLILLLDDSGFVRD